MSEKPKKTEDGKKPGTTAARFDLRARNGWDLLATVLDAMTEGVWIVDPQGRILLINRVAKGQARQLGLDPEGAQYGAELLENIEAVAADGTILGMGMLPPVLQGESLREMEIRVSNKTSGQTFFRRLSISPMSDKEGRVSGAIVLVQDITAQKSSEKERTRLGVQLHQAQKMEAVGRLAGGIAHNFNNMLAIILGNAELALDEVNGNPDAAGYIAQIIKASERARDLTRQILAFSRKTAFNRKSIHLIPLLEETYKMLRGTLPTTIRMELSTDAKPDTVLADASQIQQVLINLATNAAYAMEKNGGALSFNLSLVTIEHEGQIADAALSPGLYARLSVRDTGAGMSRSVKKRVFEPFFTTKGPGQGIGMGLPVAYGIIKHHEGEITVESEPGQGSVFTIFLPLVSPAEAARERETEYRVQGGKERILLVDDDRDVLEVVSKTLQSLGYGVTSATGGPEAYKIFERDPDAFDLVITDQIMPDLTGTALVKQIRSMKPAIPTIILTGFASALPLRDQTRAGISAYVMKPVTKREIAETVRKLLAAARSS